MRMTPEPVRRRRPRREINIVPLVDVLMVLIFFFLMTMQFREARLLNITLPEMETAGINRPGSELIIAVTRDGDFYLNQQPVSWEEMEAGLQLVGEVNPGREVLLVIDEEAPVGLATRVMDLSRKIGLDRLRLQTR